MKYHKVITYALSVCSLNLAGQCTDIPVIAPDKDWSCFGATTITNDYYVQCPGIEQGTGGYVLSFNEDFDQTTGLNTNKWQPLLYGNCHALNHTNDQLQYWTPNNLSVSNGVLNITSKTEFVPQQLMIEGIADTTHMDDNVTNLRDFNYTSGCLRSAQKFPAGLYQIKCKIASNKCLDWCFWLRYDGWTYHSQEIDGPEVYCENSPTENTKYHLNLHSSQCDPTDNISASCNSEDIADNWHIFSIQWDRYYVVWKMDDQIIREQYSLYDALAQPVLECNNSLSTANYFRYKPMPIFTNMNIFFDIAVRFPNMSNYGDDPAISQIDWIKGYTYMDCDKNVNICNWNPDRADGTVLGSIEDPTIYTGNVITASGSPSTCPVQVLQDQFLNLYAATQINIEDGFVAYSGSSFTASINPCSQLATPLFTSRPRTATNINNASGYNSFSVSPNPSNNETNVTFNVDKSGPVKIKLFSAIGDYLGTLYDQTINAGTHTQLFSTTSYNSGMYFIKIEAENYSKAQKLIITN